MHVRSEARKTVAEALPVQKDESLVVTHCCGHIDAVHLTVVSAHREHDGRCLTCSSKVGPSPKLFENESPISFEKERHAGPLVIHAARGSKERKAQRSMSRQILDVTMSLVV